MKKLLYRIRWIIIICIIGVLAAYIMSDDGYAVNYDDVINSNDTPDAYYDRVVVYVEPTQYEVKTRAKLIISDAGDGIAADSDAWKIWSINYWVSVNIDYVEDPPGGHYANAYGVLQSKRGDCDDFSILVASMYESVGLDAALVFLNTDNNPGADHMACLVYWPGDVKSFLDEEKNIMKQRKITSPFSRLRANHVFIGSEHLLLEKYDSGILLFSDIIMSESGTAVGHIEHEPYEIIQIIDVGR